MPKVGRAVGHGFIIAFCLWHMFAVALYSIPASANGTTTQWVKSTLLQFARPYLFLTSQWQQWNLFSPDPLRRVTKFVIQTKDGTEWKDRIMIDRTVASNWNSADDMKLITNLDNDSTVLIAMRVKYVQTFCKDLHLPEKVPLRLAADTDVLPAPEKVLPFSFWRTYTPQWQRHIMMETACPKRP